MSEKNIDIYNRSLCGKKNNQPEQHGQYIHAFKFDSVYCGPLIKRVLQGDDWTGFYLEII